MPFAFCPRACCLPGQDKSSVTDDFAEIANAAAFAEEQGLTQRLHFQVGDHHNRFDYPDASFDGAYSFQAVWPFFKKHELDGVVRSTLPSSSALSSVSACEHTRCDSVQAS